jgi:uncharacterized MnhB-related membrane protein
MTWDLVQNIVIVLLVLWNLSLIAQTDANNAAIVYQIRRSRRK